jgi:SWI/SNF-related matrix-associated actin-dependent regulator of chromatin subfamily A3
VKYKQIITLGKFSGILFDVTVLTSTIRVFHISLQLRIFCNHGTYQNPLGWAKVDEADLAEEEYNSALRSYGQVKCSACRQKMPIEDSTLRFHQFTTECRHVLCFDCVMNDSHNLDQSPLANLRPVERQCPLCLKKGIKSSPRGLNGQDSRSSYFQANGHSSKLSAVIQDLQEDLQHHKRYVTPLSAYCI